MSLVFWRVVFFMLVAVNVALILIALFGGSVMAELGHRAVESGVIP